MNKDFSELVEYLDKKFLDVDKKIDDLRGEFNLKFDQLLTAIDKLTNSIEMYHQEQLAIKMKMDIHEKWIFQLAEKLGLKLEY